MIIEMLNLLGIYQAKKRYKFALSCRYLFRQKKYRLYKGMNEFEIDLTSQWMYEEEFKRKYRWQPKIIFGSLCLVLKTIGFFSSALSRKKQAPVPHQLLCLLHFLGIKGSGASNEYARDVFKKGDGTHQLYRERSVTAILECLFWSTITWPDQQERKQISKRIFENYGLPNCGWYC